MVESNWANEAHNFGCLASAGTCSSIHSGYYLLVSGVQTRFTLLDLGP